MIENKIGEVVNEKIKKTNKRRKNHDSHHTPKEGHTFMNKWAAQTGLNFSN